MTEPVRAPARTYPVQTNGLTLAVTEYEPAVPDAPPLVLLHGIGSRAVSWWPAVDGLAAHFRLFVPDLRGHGASDKPAAGYLLPDYAVDLAGLVDALQLDRPRVLGHSLGGLVALRWAADHPERAAAIALEDTAFGSGPHLAPAFDGWLALSRMSVDDAAAYYLREHPHWSAEDARRRAESITAVAPGVFEELRREAVAPDRADRLDGVAAICSPILHVHGDPESGSMLLPHDAARFAAVLPHARLVRIPGGGHNLHRDATEAFLDAVVPFLLEG